MQVVTALDRETQAGKQQNEINDDEASAVDNTEQLKEMYDEWFSTEINPLINKEKCRKMAVAYLFVEAGMPDDPKDWKGPGSIGVMIKQALGLDPKFKIYKVFADIIYFIHVEKISYTGQRRTTPGSRPVVIPNDSEFAQIIADCIEDCANYYHSRSLLELQPIHKANVFLGCFR